MSIVGYVIPACSYQFVVAVWSAKGAESHAMKPNTLSLVLFAFLLYFVPTLGVEAVVPAPDGGYPGFNTAEGQNALFSLTTGGYNTAVGWLSLRNDTGGSFNTGVGAGTLSANTGDTNTATGAGALLSNTTGFDNTANGAFALLNNAGGPGNTATGSVALNRNTTGGGNTANGAQALQSNTTGGINTAIGYSVLRMNTIGGSNTAIGADALANNITGNDNIALGWEAGSTVTTANNVICIGVAGNNVDNSCYIGNIFNSTSSGGIAVFVNPNGRLGTMTSSARFKEDINPMNHASDALYALKPITFRYKKKVDPEGTSAMQFGLVAEDVEKVNPDLVVRDKEGKPYSVRYDQVNAMLLNEFLKEHRTVQELKSIVAKQEATATQQQKQIEALTAGLQKVSTQLEASKPAPQVVNNP